MREHDPYHQRRFRRDSAGMTAHLFAGLMIMGLGLLFLLDNLNVVDSGRIIRFWPVILIVFGLVRLFQTRSNSGVITGTFITAFGGLLLLNSLGIISFRYWQLWPLFLIVFGCQMLMRSMSHSSSRGAPVQNGPVTDASATFSSFAVLGGVKRHNSSQAFRGGEATAFMGGVELDFRHAKIEGGEAIIDIFAMWGGIVIRVPETWNVDVRITPILGGVDDKTTHPANSSERLILKGMVLMGGVEIKD